METTQINRVYTVYDLNQSGLEYKEYNLSIHDELVNEFKTNNPGAIVNSADGVCVPYTIEGENDFNYIVTITYEV